MCTRTWETACLAGMLTHQTMPNPQPGRAASDAPSGSGAIPDRYRMGDDDDEVVILQGKRRRAAGAHTPGLIGRLLCLLWMLWWPPLPVQAPLLLPLFPSVPGSAALRWEVLPPVGSTASQPFSSPLCSLLIAVDYRKLATEMFGQAEGLDVSATAPPVLPCISCSAGCTALLGAASAVKLHATLRLEPLCCPCSPSCRHCAHVFLACLPQDEEEGGEGEEDEVWSPRAQQRKRRGRWRKGSDSEGEQEDSDNSGGEEEEQEQAQEGSGKSGAEEESVDGAGEQQQQQQQQSAGGERTTGPPAAAAPAAAALPASEPQQQQQQPVGEAAAPGAAAPEMPAAPAAPTEPEAVAAADGAAA